MALSQTAPKVLASGAESYSAVNQRGVGSWSRTFNSNMGYGGNDVDSTYSDDYLDKAMYVGSDKLFKLEPSMTPFSTIMARLKRMAINTPRWKGLESRATWQRRNGYIAQIGSATNAAYDLWITSTTDNAGIQLLMNDTGAYAAANFTKPNFMLVGQDISFSVSGTVYTAKVVTVAAAADSDITTGLFANSQSDATKQALAKTMKVSVSQINPLYGAGVPTAAVYTTTTSAGAPFEITGSAFAEGSGAPTGYHNELTAFEMYTQIFKNATEAWSGTDLATEHRGTKDRFKEAWVQATRDHKVDIEKALLFGRGQYDGQNKISRTWGILPYVEAYGKVYNMSYGLDGYDRFVDVMSDFYSPESGNTGDKLIFASKKIMNWFNKIGTGSFLGNTFGTKTQAEISNIQSNVGFGIKKVSTDDGAYFFVHNPWFRGPYEDYSVAIDLRNVAWRPLEGNGISRDTTIFENIVSPNVGGTDAYVNLIQTEGGLEITYPETHAIFKWA